MTDLIDRRLLSFLLYDWLHADRLVERTRFAEHSRESFEAMLDAANQLASSEFATHNRAGDLNEPAFDGERVRLIPEIKRALDAFAAAGFLAMTPDAEHGGLQLPTVIEKAVFAHFCAANIATSGYPFLTIANANLLLAHGSAAQIERFARPQLAGRFFGTMCLSEPQAGSSLSDIRTRALRDAAAPDSAVGARYRLFGHKTWISAGEHGLAENIVHLVLAKIPRDDGTLPTGVKGISLFIVPRSLVGEDGVLGERNDVALAGLNHKLGYRGTVNTLLNFGEGRFTPEGTAGAIGYLIGEPGTGLAIMFRMMNEARIGVGLGAAMLGYAGYRASLAYARERPQGRPVGGHGKDAAQPQVPIVRHADVKRMLLAQKAYAEGSLALSLYCARLVDDERTATDPAARSRAQRLLDILTPIAKSWPSEWCVEGNSLAIQVLGGAGYTRDYPVEQYWRDNRLNMIHEGTHGIQALDLLGRKVLLDNGALLAELGQVIGATVARAQGCGDAGLAEQGATLGSAAARVSRATHTAWHGRDPQAALAHATPYLQAFGHVVIGWVWLDLALTAVASKGLDACVRAAVVNTGRWFHAHEMPRVAAWLQPLERGDRTVLDTQEDWL
ncbi:MAG: acyl-CoA dehydrogenase [Burkholderiaceae bacterium]|jgi:butyryl-CoA dehydrogenase|nr:acyl-CoA dehydrogenase [Burkholderiaceae bacterium]